MERAVLMSDSQRITTGHLPHQIAGAQADDASGGDASLWGYEKAMIIKALNSNNWNQSKASRELGISRDNLRYRIKKYAIAKPE